MKKSGVKTRAAALKKIVGVFVLVSLGPMALGTATVAYILKTLPRPEDFSRQEIAQSTKIYDRTGQTLLFEVHGEEKRTFLSLNDVPEPARWATLAIEDAEFYKHPAFNWKSALRALVTNLAKGQIVQGGSTITQQLAKNLFLTPERTLVRKIKELILAIQLENLYTKDQILELYLNQVAYGSNAYGIEAASQIYFGKSAREVNAAEAAALASLIKAPTYYSPWGSHRDELLQRKDYVIERMFRLGFLDEEEKQRALKTPLNFEPQRVGLKAPHFTMMVREYLLDKYGEDVVERGGLKVVTALDLKLQETAERVVKEGAARNEELYGGKNAALVAQDPKTGQVVALVGSRDFFDVKNEGNFNVAARGRRQPGSAFKPFAYITAFKKGYSPETVVFDLPTEFDTTGDPAKSYQPENFDNKFRGVINLRNALAQSVNIPAVKVLYLAGLDDTLKTARDFGITTLTERGRYGLSLVLGGGEVTLLEMVGAYSVFAEEGLKRSSTLILKIEDANGKVLEEFKEEATPVVEPQYARLINDILSDNDARAPLFGANSLLVIPDRETAAKTGTSNDYRDAWTIGYSPSLVVGVWAGNNNNSPMQKHAGSILAAVPIWSAFMTEVLKDRPLEVFARPEPVYVNKPVLAGEYVVDYAAAGEQYPQTHNILFYINKNDPLGAGPENPESDPQFKNWEAPVLVWAARNIPDFYNRFNKPLPPGAEPPKPAGGDSIKISVSEPENGDFINGLLSLKANIESPADIKKIELFFNGDLVESRAGDLGKIYAYRHSFYPLKLNPQNLITIVATNSFDKKAGREIIVFSP